MPVVFSKLDPEPEYAVLRHEPQDTSWKMSDKVVLRNQSRNLFDLPQKHKQNPQDLRSNEEVERGIVVTSLI